MRYTRIAVGRVTTFRVLLASLLAGGVAAAQQGLIVQPWRKPTAVPSAVVPTSHTLPASGLPQVNAPSPRPRQLEPVASAVPPAPPVDGSWTPPVVTLLVDPWAKPGQLAPAARRHWVPTDTEIIDPWATDNPAEPPRVAASRRADVPRDTIF